MHFLCTLKKQQLIMPLVVVFFESSVLSFCDVHCEIIISRGCTSFKSRFMCVFLQENMPLTSLFLTRITLLLLPSVDCRFIPFHLS